MSQTSLYVSLSPKDALAKVQEYIPADLVYQEFQSPDGDTGIGTLVFEKYYFRTKNRAALVVIADDFGGSTHVRAVATGSSEGMIFNFDWGASDNFVGQVERILDPYIIQTTE